MKLDSILRFLDSHPKPVAISLLAVLVAGAVGGTLYISALRERLLAVEEQRKGQIATAKRANLELAARLELFESAAAGLLVLTEDTTKLNSVDCPIRLNGLVTECDKIRQALREAKILEPIFRELSDIASIVTVDDPSERLMIAAHSLLKVGDTAAAEKAIRMSLEIAPTGVAFAELALLLGESGEEAEALAAYEEAVGLLREELADRMIVPYTSAEATAAAEIMEQ